MRKLFFILMAVVACVFGAAAQTHTISGSVLDAANNEPLIGVTIAPIGGGQGVAVDSKTKCKNFALNGTNIF